VSGDPRAVWDAVRGWWDEPDAPLVVRTSGSTGEPRDVELSHRALAASVAATRSRLGGDGQWLLALPVTGVGGLQVLLRSAAAGVEPVFAADDWGQAVAALTGERAYTSLVPTQLHRLAAAQQLSVLRRFAAVLVGGAAIDDRLASRCADEGVPVVRTYGMTETCGGCVYDGLALDGVAIRLDVEGRISIAGPVLFDGYVGDPDATAQALSAGWFTSSDLGRIDDDGRLVVIGRADDVVVSGGVKVALPAVTQALTTLPGVTDAVAVGVPDAEWGTRVVAVVVAARPPAITAVRHLVSATLPRAWAPRAVLAVPAMPLLPGGKLDRRELQRLAAGARSSRS
jgi:O-succinylbenzoic acid--CoA ligase